MRITLLKSLLLKLFPIKILPRYILTEIFQFFLISLAVFLSILVTGKMLRLTSLVVNKGVELTQILTILGSIVPSFLEIALPMSVLLGVMLAFGRISGDSEITVIRASGVPLHSLIIPCAIFGLITTTMALGVSIYLRPIANHALESALFDIASSRSTAGLTAGIFNRLGALTIYTESINYENGALTNVLIDDRRDPESRQIISSKRGQILAENEQRTIQIHLYDGDIHATTNNQGGYNLTHFDHNRIFISPKELSSGEAKGMRPREMLIPELQAKAEELRLLASQVEQSTDAEALLPTLPNNLSSLKKIKERIVDFEIEIGRKFSYPFACLVFALLAMPFGIQPARSHRTWGQSLSAVLGITVIITYYALSSFGMTLSKGGSISTTVALWAPNFIFLALAIFALRKMGSEKWQSILQGFEELLTKISRVIFRQERV